MRIDKKRLSNIKNERRQAKENKRAFDAIYMAEIEQLANEE